MTKEFYAKVYGELDGDVFRQFAKEKAQSLTIVGYAKNLDATCVEIVAQGEEENLKKFAEAISAGPEDAPVDSLEIEWGKPAEEFSLFTINQ